MRSALAVVLVACACRSKVASDHKPATTTPATTGSAAGAAPTDATDALVTAWTWQRARRCLDDIELPVPPGWSLRELPMADDRCMSSVSPADRTAVNVERSTTDDRATVKTQLGKSWTIKSTLREETTANGWLLAIEVESFRPLVYAHRSDLKITCMGVGTEDLETTRRVCAEARRVAGAATAGAALPAEVNRLVARWEECWHWAGEEPYDAARKQQIAEGVAKSCPGNAEEREKLRGRYADRPDVLDALKKLDEMQ